MTVMEYHDHTNLATTKYFIINLNGALCILYLWQEGEMRFVSIQPLGPVLRPQVT